MRSSMRVRAVAGVVLLVLALVLGAIARTSAVTNDDYRVDHSLSTMRFGVGNTVSEDLTSAAQEGVGIGILAVALIALFLLRRRWDALRLLAAAGASWVVAIVIKNIIERHRPPSTLWVIAPDNTPSFPSGHTTTATVVLVILAVLAWRLPRLRALAVTVGVLFALAVGFSRIYLGDHYPTDVLGAYLTVAGTALLVWALADLAVVRSLAARVLHDPTVADQPDGVADGTRHRSPVGATTSAPPPHG